MCYTFQQLHSKALHDPNGSRKQCTHFCQTSVVSVVKHALHVLDSHICMHHTCRYLYSFLPIKVVAKSVPETKFLRFSNIYLYYFNK